MYGTKHYLMAIVVLFLMDKAESQSSKFLIEMNITVE